MFAGIVVAAATVAGFRQMKTVSSLMKARVLLLGGFVVLAGCGGGGEDSGATGGATAALPGLGVLSQFFVQSFSTAELQAASNLRNSDVRYTTQNRSWYFDTNSNNIQDGSEPTRTTYPLASARIEYAHALGLYGTGVTVGILDEGFLPTHETIASNSTLGAFNNTVAMGHGTAVASVLGGQSSQMIGVAPAANLLLGIYDSTASRVELTNRATAAGAVAINHSWGFPTQATQANFDAQFVRGSDRPYLDALRTYTQRGVAVFAISNQSTNTTSELMDALPLFAPELEQGWLAVVNGDAVWDAQSVTAATRLSAPCNDAARWCLAAEGTWWAANATGTANYSLVTGSSFAAPMVTGALALLQQAFPNLTPHELRVRLLASADNDFAGFVPAGSVELADGFAHAYSREWGHGFLDVRAALLPIGTTATRMADGTLHDLSAPLAATGGASGDAVTRSLSDTRILATDSLGGDFRVGADSLVAQVAPVAAADRLVATLARTDRPDTVFGEYGGASLGLRAGEAEVAVLLPSPGDTDPRLGLSVGRSLPAGAGAVYLGVNVTQDDGRLLPVGTGGATARMAAVEMGYSQQSETAFWSLAGGIGLADTAEMGALTPAAMTLSGLRAETGRRDLIRDGDRLSLGVALPMAVVSGSVQTRLPMTRAAGGIDYRPVTVDYAPDSREVNLSLVYSTPVGRGADLMVGGIRSFNHGHVAGQTDSAAMMALRLTF